jgi:hypothetical protein
MDYLDRTRRVERGRAQVQGTRQNTTGNILWVVLSALSARIQFSNLIEFETNGCP